MMNEKKDEEVKLRFCNAMSHGPAYSCHESPARGTIILPYCSVR